MSALEEDRQTNEGDAAPPDLRRRNHRTGSLLALLVLGFVLFGLWHLGAFR